MNIQTEQIENHRARVTVEVGNERLEKAKKDAARKLSKRLNIPGFRKGKAPYRIVQNYVGEGAILEDAIEELGNVVYVEMLNEADVQPYGPGSLEDFQIEPEPTFIFTLPLQPEIDLKDYRSVRLDYEEPEITEDQVEEALQNLQERFAEANDTEDEIAIGHRVTLDIHSEFVDGDEAPEDDAEENEENDEEPKAYKGDSFYHQHDFSLILDEDEEPVVEGFKNELLGAKAGDEVEVTLTVPDEERFEGIVGREVEFHVEIKKVEEIDLPELDDDFAAKVTEHEDEPKTLEELRADLEENLRKQTIQSAEEEYANQVLDLMIEQAEVNYPDMVVDDRISDMIKEFEQSIRYQGISIDDYYKITNTTEEDLREQYRENAESSVRRSLVFQEFAQQEQLTLSAEEIDAGIDDMVKDVQGDFREQYRQMLNEPQARQRTANDLFYRKGLGRLRLIGQGEELPELETEEEPAEETES